MPSPFPGMDPYLEHAERWPNFRHQLIAAMYQVLLPGLVDRYRARVSSRNYSVEVPLFTSVQREQHAEEFIEIRDRADGSLTTLIDVTSIANRVAPAGREAYMSTRRYGEQQRAALVDIDLITQGEPLLDFPRDNLPEYDYAVTVTRPGAPGRFEIYAVTLQKRLPKFRLPLNADDRDLPLELQDVFRRAYDLGGFQSRIDYTEPPPAEVQLSNANRQWIDAWLHQQKRR